MAGRQPLLVGHKISLLYDASQPRTGYIQATWSTGHQSSAPVGLLPLRSRDDPPPNFEDCIFQILSGDTDMSAKKKGAREEIKFGQIIRLIHVSQGKALCCSKKKSGAADKSSKRVTLEPCSGQNGVKKGWTSKWRIAPRYQVRGEGEKVCEDDQITLQPVFSCGGHFLSVAEHPIVGSSFLEVNGAPKDARDSTGALRELGLTIKAYDTDDLDTDFLRGGDCLMLYHKEQHGYLIGNPVEEGAAEVYLLPSDGGDKGLDDKDPATYLSNGMFIVECDDPLQGGAMKAASWHKSGGQGEQRFRLRLLGNGAESYYLTLRRSTPEEVARRSANEQQFAAGGAGAGRQSTPGTEGEMQRVPSMRRHRDGAEALPEWTAGLCRGEDVRDDRGTLFQFLQTGDNQEQELSDTSRVIVWASTAGRAADEKKSVFLHVSGERVLSDIRRTDVLLHIGCSERALQKDGFELRKVPADSFLALNSILSQIPPIRSYTAELLRLADEMQQSPPDLVRQMEISRGLEPDRLIASLEEMIERCFQLQYTQNIVDVLEIDCTPDKAQQLLLVDQSVPRTCLALLKAQAALPFSAEELFSHAAQYQYNAGRGSISNTEVNPPKKSLRITNLCYKLIRSSVKGSPDLAARVSMGFGEGWMQFIFDQSTFKHDIVGAVPCLIELFRDNRVLHHATTLEFLDLVCNQIVENQWRCEFIRLLPFLISSETEVVERLQARACERLLQIPDPPLLRMGLQDGELKVRTPFGSMEGLCEDDEPEPQWVGIEQFCDVSEEVKNKVIGGRKVISSRMSVSTSTVIMRMDDIYEYFRLQIILFSRFCLGKGQGAKERAELVQQFVPEKCIFETIFGKYDDVIPDGMQCVFVQLACTALLDDYINIHHQTQRVVKVWDRFDEVTLKLDCLNSVVSMKEHCLEYLRKNDTHSLRYPTSIEKTIGYMRMLSLFLRSGFVMQEEIPEVASLLASILDGTTDQYLPLGSDSVFQADESYVEHRGEFTEESMILLHLRERVVDNLSVLLDFAASRDVDAVLLAVKTHITSQKRGVSPDDVPIKFPFLSQIQTFSPDDKIDEIAESNYIEPSEDDNLIFQGIGMVAGGLKGGLNLMADVGGILGDMLLGEGEKRFVEANRLLEVLLDVGQYNYTPLRESATRLLYRLTNRGDHILSVCRSAQILCSESSVDFYREANYLVEQLSDLVNDCYDTERINAMLKIVTRARDMCFLKGSSQSQGMPAPEHQSILSQLEAHSLLLQMPWCELAESGPLPTHMEGLVEMIFSFLTAMTADHDDNKELLIEGYIQTIVNCLPYECGAFELLVQLYETNPKHCITAPDSVIRAMLTVPIRIPYVQFLLKLMRPRNRNIFRKQQAVYTNISDLWAGEINFLGSSDRTAWTTSRKKMKMVEELLKQQEYLTATGQVAMHFTLLNLLRAVAQGKEISLKGDIRQDIWTDRYADPVEHIMGTCARKELPFWYRAGYMHFFREVVVDDAGQIPSVCSQKLYDNKYGIVSVLQLCLQDVLSWPPALSSAGSAPDTKYADNADVIEPSSSKGVKFEAIADVKRDAISGVGLKSSAVHTDFVFLGVLPVVKHFMEAFFKKEELQKDLDLYGQVIDALSDLVRAFLRIVDVQKSELHSAALGGGADDMQEVVPVSYVNLVAHAEAYPDSLHAAAAKQHSRLLPKKLRRKLSDFLQLAEGYEEFLGRIFPPSGCAEIAAEIKSQGAKEEEDELDPGPQGWIRHWKQCVKRLSISLPCLDEGKKFRSLSILLMRKGDLGKSFICRTLIGRESEGLIFAKDSPGLQIDSLTLLARLCEDLPMLALLDQEGGDDANILLPEPCHYLPVVEEEEQFGDGDRTVLSPQMELIAKQNTLNSFGMSEKLVTLVEAPGVHAMGLSNTTLTALKTGSALLCGGNAEVQDSIARYFMMRNDEDFFVHIRGQLRLFSESLKDLTRTLKKEVTKRSNASAPVARAYDDDDDAHYSPLNPKLEAIPNDIVDDMKERFFIAHMTTVIKFLQLLTEGHHLVMQNYLREQVDNHTSIDIVGAVASFLQQFKYLNRVTSEVMSGTLNCLVEFVQGPCSGNQHLLISQNIGETICKILNDGTGPQVFKADMIACGDSAVAADLWDIRQSAVDLLIGLVEGGVPSTTAKLLLSNVSLDVLAANMYLSYTVSGLGKDVNLLESAFGAGKGLVTDLLKPEGSGSELDDQLNLGCGIFIFLKVMLDAQLLRERELGYKEVVVWHDKDGRSLKQVLRREEVQCYQYFNQTVAAIEIARGDSVERVYFRVLEKSRANLPEKSKEVVTNTVHRDSGDGARVTDFFDKCIGLIHEIGYYEEMRNTRGLAVIHKFSVPLEWMSLFLSFAINIYLLAVVNHDPESFTIGNVTHVYDAGVGGDRNDDEVLTSMGRTIIVLQCLQMVHFGMGPTRIYLDFKWREWEQVQEDEAMRECKRNLSVTPVDRTKLGKDKLLPTHYLVHTLYMMSHFWPFWQRGVYLVSTFMGYYISPVWYCAQPLQIVEFSPKLMNVVLAVTTNGKSLLLTMGLMMIVVFVFASWAFFGFSQYFDEEGDGGVDTGFNCDTLFRCWLLLLTYGLRQGGGISDIIPRPDMQDSAAWQRIIFDMLYFLLLVVLFLNIVFGIIIDTFAELRVRREFIEDDQQSKCFICGMDRSVFDREASAQGGFEHHYKNEHNMWTYLLFLHYIFEKDKDALTGQEKYVRDMVDEKDPAFFPIGKSIILHHQAPGDAGPSATM